MGSQEPIGAIGFRILVAIFLTACVLAVVLTTGLILLPHYGTDPLRLNCPDKRLNLEEFPYNNGTNIVLSGGRSFLISKPVTSAMGINLVITDGATLVIADSGQALTLDFQNILIDGGGSLLIGWETCRYQSPLNIKLHGNNDSSSPDFGQKFIGVAASGTLEIHGQNKLSWTRLAKSIKPGAADTVIELDDAAVGWMTADQIVIASSDYDMEHSEVFSLVACPECKPNQVKIKGPIRFGHVGEVSLQGVDLRAEVGLLTRNVKISGVMKSACTSQCNVINFDTFGGHIMVLRDAKSFRLEGVELESMGQAKFDSRNPVNFYKVESASSHYVKQLSIHKSYSRCVVLEATQNLLVQDVVGYDTMGHCFYMSTGTEQNNILRHNLGLVTRSGLVAPSERNDRACMLLSSNYNTNGTNHITNSDKECNGVATFFLTNPNNTLVNNSAAGSESTGFSYSFYLSPLGVSPDPNRVLPQRIPLKEFLNNTAHSNKKIGFSLGRGIKSTQPTQDDPTDYLSLNDDAQYAPHVNADLSKDRDAAIISSLTAYLNGLAISVRGGDITIKNALLSDNDIGVIMSSSDKLPYDIGSRQTFKDSTVVGATSMNDSTWSNRLIPSFGVQFNNGPVLVHNVEFINFIDFSNRSAFAFAFVPNNTGQLSVRNTIGDCKFTNVTKMMALGYRGGYWGNNDKDGDLFQIVQDLYGSITGVQASFIVRPDIPLLTSDACQRDETYTLSVCPATSYGQVFVRASTKSAYLSLYDSSNPVSVVTLSGVDRNDPRQWNMTQYQATLRANKNYRAFWIDATIPSTVEISMYNFHLNDYVNLEFCYPSNTSFSIFGNKVDPMTGLIVSRTELFDAFSLEDFNNINQQLYFWNATRRLLTVKLVSDAQATGSNYCAADGCNSIEINADTGENSPFTDCE